uniref:Uncharacterized protein n=1 Tax=Knipowitschia caucasica TaxID=637954 RepID=A0AAV2KR57_KNICA
MQVFAQRDWFGTGPPLASRLHRCMPQRCTWKHTLSKHINTSSMRLTEHCAINTAPLLQRRLLRTLLKGFDIRHHLLQTKEFL